MEAFLLLVTDAKNDDGVVEYLRSLGRVVEFYRLYGYYDILARVSVNDPGELSKLQREILNTGRVLLIETLICAEGES
ncbi:Lrp/AsnC ligand binding domain-containing protein [Thermococcus peptonophilus]|uniref:Transcription regulator AsnC/Lrp ligand binding domain-containing protein n=1 Tax=Thermococcus peptonophilus TaxID=53952 RepID=A0A142CTY2_9EURY|nr:Lrp/AsnC ligand binding domain-containing protein [Thermococcus peptonophilus]AMQ18234.1 hypothetical protein A0127_03145 [Thermococcus peptonophilus]